MTDLWTRVRAAFDVADTVNSLIQWIPQLFAASLVLAAFWGVERMLRRTLGFVMRRAEVDETAVAFMQNVVRYTMFTVALITALSQVGVDVAGILTSLGVVGLTIGFAAKDALSNVISGLFIFWDRPFVIGDLVEIGDAYGRVQEITMRSTRVVTADGRMLAIPNNTIVNSIVASYTNFPNLRLDIPVTVAVSEDLGRIRALLLGIPQEDPRYLSDPMPVVVVTALNDYNVALELRAWLRDERTHVAERAELRERVFEVLRAAGVDMPFETFALSPVEVRQQRTQAIR